MATADELRRQVTDAIGRNRLFNVVRLAKKLDLTLGESPAELAENVKAAMESWVTEHGYTPGKSIDLPEGKATVKSGVQWNSSWIPTIAVELPHGAAANVRVEGLIDRAQQ